MATCDDQDLEMIQLIYASAATKSFSDAELQALLDGARVNNASLDVTGVLLFADGTFFQVLEGDSVQVQALYDKIALDTRHDNLLLLSKSSIKERNFGQWSMGFIRDRTQIEELPGFVDFFRGGTFLDLAGDSQRMQQILQGFRRGRWRRQSEAYESSAT